ncbi:putative bifunctional diguanylate cyclase/phosphodiesterase [Jidongwangia harbinensis]|uniref:putative bifunctional diguanylate cyclase/phosphodiesterase n=1 Tax=Jidongwangia harbinensis TaxID=2878561 RepID=UPI001CD94388|nr:EAL domain-containing protein [Jidongwangia harbinensis]MCA2217772.1 EAL domain-containing protein [Jidongwangia harbinensis]
MARDPDPPLRPVLATVAVLVAGCAWYAAYVTVGAGTEALAYSFLPIGGLISWFAVFRLCRGVALGPVAVRFWRRLLVAVGLLTVGYGWLGVDMLVHHPDAATRTMPVPAAALVAIGFTVAMWAVARVPAGSPAPGERWRLHLDRMIAFLGCSTVLWHFGLAPMLTADERWSSQAMVLVALSFLLAVGGITKVSYLAAGAVDRTAIRLIAAMGLTAAAVAVLAVRYGYAGGVPAQSVVMPVAPVLVTLAARAQWHSTGVDRTARRRDNKLLPYAGVAAAAVPLLAVAFGPVHWTARTVIVAAVLVAGLITARQFVAFRENARLLHEKRVSEERLQHEVTHDGLTGLANRALFRDRLAAALATGDEGDVTVLLIDLDDFKAVNDSLGHGVGDRLLVSLARVLREQTAGDGLPVRLGGDEFAVLMVGGTVVGETVAQRLHEALSRPLGEDRLLVQASIGIATAGAGTTRDALLRHADVAMYAAKQRGKANHVRFVPGMEEPVQAHMQLGGELRRALDAGEFRVFYQPVLNLVTGRVAGVEALARWQHPTRGLVSPAEFIPAAERTGLIVPLGRWVLRETCRQAAAWLAEFGPDALDKAGPNVSARQLHDPDFVADVSAALADSGLPADRLLLELTESEVLRGRQVSQALHQLDDMGVHLALDDFGTGESSLSLLRSFPAAVVKLDKSFVDGIEIDDGDPAACDARQAVARAVIQLADALRLEAVAEGVENGAQAAKLRELGYVLGQGYHLARPMPAADLTRLLAAQRDAAAPATPESVAAAN